MTQTFSTLASVCIISIVSTTLAGHSRRDTGGGGSWTNSAISGHVSQEWDDSSSAYGNSQHNSVGPGQWSSTSSIGHDIKRSSGWNQVSSGGHDSYQASHTANHGYDSGRRSVGKEEWKPYRFAYSAQGHDGGSDREEKTDEHGRVTGWYTLTTADGRKRKVTYVADENGFRAKVETNEQGTANEDPASVHLRSHAPKVMYPVPAPKNQNGWDNVQENQGWSPAGPGATGSGHGSWTIIEQTSQQNRHQQQQDVEWNQHATSASRGTNGYGGTRIRKLRHQHAASGTPGSRTGHQGWSITRKIQHGPNGGSWSARRGSLPPPVKSSVHWNSNSGSSSSNNNNNDPWSNGVHPATFAWQSNDSPHSNNAKAGWTDSNANSW